jgi:hypothetical protein
MRANGKNGDLREQVTRRLELTATSLGKYLGEWLDSARATLKPKSVIQYEQIIRDHITPHMGTLRLQDLRLDRIDKFYGELLRKGWG